LKDKLEGSKGKIDLSEFAEQRGFAVDLKIVREKIAAVLAVSIGIACFFLATVPMWLPE
jgi:hypothetical protein